MSAWSNDSMYWPTETETVTVEPKPARVLGYVCRCLGSIKTVATRDAKAFETAPSCTGCRRPMVTVGPAHKDAYLFPARRCFACGCAHRPNAEC